MAQHILIVPPGADLDATLAEIRRTGVTDCFATTPPGGATTLRFTGPEDWARAARAPSGPLKAKTTTFT